MRGLEHVRAHSPLSDTFPLASVFTSLGFEEKQQCACRLLIHTRDMHSLLTFRYVT